MTPALQVNRRTMIAIALTCLVGIVAFGWPLLAAPQSTAVAHAGDAPWIFAVTIPLLLAVIIASFRDGGMDAKAVAMLGVLAAVIAVLRTLGAGVAGLEPIWVILILGGRALGPGFGFALGAVSLFASGLLTGGVGPWLPFQMLAAAWVGMGAGLLPRVTGRTEVFMMAAYGGVVAFLYGLIMNLWFWPFLADLPAQISFTAGAGLTDNVLSWVRFTMVTSLGYDIPRAILTVVLILIAGAPILGVLRRVARKANFQPAPEFVR